MAQIYVPDTLEFDFSGIMGTIGSGLLSGAKYVASNLLTKANVSTVVGAVVAKQLQQKQPSFPPPGGMISATQTPAPPGTMYGLVPTAPGVTTQPIIIGGGGGGGAYPTAPMAAPAGFAINPMYIMAGIGILALVMTTRR